MSDTLSNLFSHIKNGQKNGLFIIKSRYSHTVIAILNILTDHGYIRGYRFCSNKFKGKKTPFRKQIEILLKYHNKKAATSNLVRVSKPSRKIYLSVDQLVQIANLSKSSVGRQSKLFGQNAEDTILSMQGTFILSTSKGIMPNTMAQKLHVGGEVLGHVCSS